MYIAKGHKLSDKQKTKNNMVYHGTLFRTRSTRYESFKRIFGMAIDSNIPGFHSLAPENTPVTLLRCPPQNDMILKNNTANVFWCSLLVTIGEGFLCFGYCFYLVF